MSKQVRRPSSRASSSPARSDEEGSPPAGLSSLSGQPPQTAAVGRAPAPAAPDSLYEFHQPAPLPPAHHQQFIPGWVFDRWGRQFWVGPGPPPAPPGVQAYQAPRQVQPLPGQSGTLLFGIANDTPTSLENDQKEEEEEGEEEVGKEEEEGYEVDRKPAKRNQPDETKKTVTISKAGGSRTFNYPPPTFDWASQTDVSKLNKWRDQIFR